MSTDKILNTKINELKTKLYSDNATQNERIGY